MVQSSFGLTFLWKFPIWTLVDLEKMTNSFAKLSWIHMHLKNDELGQKYRVSSYLLYIVHSMNKMIDSL
jgi:hypothetical protein